MENEKTDPIIKATLMFLTAGVIAVIFYFLRSIFIPITIALLISILSDPLFNFLRKKLRLPSIVSTLVILALFFFVVFLGGLYLGSRVNVFADKFDSYKDSYVQIYEKYATRLEPIWEKLNEEPFDLDGVVHLITHGSLPEENANPQVTEVVESTSIAEIDTVTEADEGYFSPNSLFADLNFSAMLNSLIMASNSIFGFVGDVVLVALFLLFILLEKNSYDQKMKKVFTDTKGLQVRKILAKINHHVVRYINVKVWISLLTALLVVVVAVLVGVDFPSMWGVLAFILNFIPSIGSIIFVFLMTFFTAIQFLPTEQWGAIVIVFFSTGIIQFVIGNILDPKVSGDKLDLSPLTIMFALLFWGLIWGIPGMFLSVPLMLVIKLTCENIPSLRPFAILIGSGNEAFDKKEDTIDRLYRKIKDKCYRISRKVINIRKKGKK